MNESTHRIIAVLSLIGAGLVVWNQYFNGPIGGDPILWNYIDPYVIIVLLLATVALWKSSE